MVKYSFSLVLVSMQWFVTYLLNLKSNLCVTKPGALVNHLPYGNAHTRDFRHLSNTLIILLSPVQRKLHIFQFSSIPQHQISTKLGKYLENEGRANSHRDRILSTLTMGSQCLAQLSSFQIYFQVDLNSKLMVNFWLPTIWPSSQWLLWHCGIGLSENWKSTACLTIPHFSAGADFLGIDAKNNAGTRIYMLWGQKHQFRPSMLSASTSTAVLLMCLCLG